MKLLAVLIAIILLAGSLDYCQESENCENSGKVEVCSPLCHCSGCVFSIVIPKVTQPSFLSVVIPNEYDISLKSVVPTISYSIWQPPRLLVVLG